MIWMLYLLGCSIFDNLGDGTLESELLLLDDDAICDVFHCMQSMGYIEKKLRVNPVEC